MKKGYKILTLIITVLLLVSCSVSVRSVVTASAAKTPPASSSFAVLTTAPASASSLSPTLSPKPVSTINILPSNLPDPAAWASSLKMDVKDYPRVDGSTATLPLAVYIRSKITGEPLASSAAETVFSMTGPAYEALINKDADILVVYEAPDEIKQEIDDNGISLLQKPIGLDALVFLTNSGNNVDSLTQQQIIDIYTGKIINWKLAAQGYNSFRRKRQRRKR